MVAAALVLLWLALQAALEIWVFRAFPYDADPAALDRNFVAREIATRALRPDAWFRQAIAKLRGTRPHPDIVLLNVDYDVLATEDAWPLPRRVFAEIFERLAAARPRLVVVDGVFEWPQTPWVADAVTETLPPEQPGVRALLRELDHDGRLRDALARLDHVLIYFIAENYDATHDAMRARYAANMARHAERPRVAVEGGRALAVFPRLRAIGVRDSLLPLQLRASGQGYARTITDRTGFYAAVPLLHRLQTTETPPRSFWLPHAAVEAVRTLDGAPGYTVELDDGRVEAIRIGGRRVRTDALGEVEVDFYGRGLVPLIPVVRAQDLLEGKVDAAMLAGKLVVFGTDLLLLQDYHVTPVGRIWGTEILATEISNLLQRDSLRRPAWAAWAEAALMLSAFAMVLAATLRLRPAVALAAALAAVAALALFVGWLYVARGLSLSLVVPASLAAATFLQASLMRYVIEERRRRTLHTALSLYLSPELTRQVSENPALLSLDGKAIELTVLFSDIRGFTSISETMTPEGLTSFLHEYLTPMTDAVFETGGTLDKYIGDAVMAFWGAPLDEPDHAGKGCEAALRMLERLATLQAGWRSRGLPPIEIGVGLNTGPMRVGNMGSDKRLSYTVMGDNVNLGSRLEGLTKHYGVRLIVSGATWEKVAGRFHGRQLDLVKVKGKDQAVPIHEIAGRGDAPPELAAAHAVWAAARAAYLARDWDAAEAGFRAWAERGDATARHYLEAIAEFRVAPPPPGWEGVTKMETK